jgi:hypothetical protein
MRLIVLGAAALLLSGCGGEEYPVPAGEAFTTLSGVGTPDELYPLPGGLYEVGLRFESVPADNSVQWHFSHEGDDLARLVAKVEPNGDTASKVSVNYVEGTAPDENWRNGQARKLIQTAVQQLVVEAIDSKLEKRPFDKQLLGNVRATTAAMSVGGMMQDASASLDKHIAEEKQSRKEAQARAEANPYAKTKPSMDLSKFN